MNIPEEVLAAAAGLVEMYGPNFQFLGSREGFDFFLFLTPGTATSGYPSVFAYKGGQALQLPGEEAVRTMRSFGIE